MFYCVSVYVHTLQQMLLLLATWHPSTSRTVNWLEGKYVVVDRRFSMFSISFVLRR